MSSPFALSPGFLYILYQVPTASLGEVPGCGSTERSLWFVSQCWQKVSNRDATQVASMLDYKLTAVVTCPMSDKHLRSQLLLYKKWGVGHTHVTNHQSHILDHCQTLLRTQVWQEKAPDVWRGAAGSFGVSVPQRVGQGSKGGTLAW